MKEDITPYVRFLLAIQKPDLQGVWLDGKDCAMNNLSLDENPFRQGTREYSHWNEGWWEGLAKSAMQDKTSSIKTSLKAANDSYFTGKKVVQDWFEGATYAFGALVTGVMAYELVDIAI